MRAVASVRPLPTPINTFSRGENILVDVVAWYHEMRRETPDIYADQDWSGLHQK